jgi:hypothetical protein
MAQLDLDEGEKATVIGPAWESCYVNAVDIEFVGKDVLVTIRSPSGAHFLASALTRITKDGVVVGTSAVERRR